MKTESEEPAVENREHNHEMHGEMMDSEPVSFSEVVDGTLTYYTCPMEFHSYVKMKEPGSCPECGMTLVQK